ncbi:MAG: hypothetical protein WCI05_18170 [Myxococcales bacterium]
MNLQELRQRHLVFLEQRLHLDEAQWRHLLEPMMASLLQRPLCDLVSEPALERLLDSATSHDMVMSVAKPIAAALHAEIARELHVDTAPLGTYIPTTARTNIDALLERPPLMSESLVRQVLVQEALEEVLRDVLHDALKEFNEKVNPFFAEWALPALLKKVFPLGAGTVLKALGGLRVEFDKRLDPEIRKFLLGFSSRALRKVADIVVAKREEPAFVAIGKTVAAWLYEQPMQELVKNFDAQARTLLDTIGITVSAHVLALESVRSRRRAVVGAFFERHGKETVAEILTAYGVVFQPDLDSLAAATWPLLQRSIETPAVRQLLLDLVTAFYDEEASSSETPWVQVGQTP